jgi:hypothetical protein
MKWKIFFTPRTFEETPLKISSTVVKVPTNFFEVGHDGYKKAEFYADFKNTNLL